MIDEDNKQAKSIYITNQSFSMSLLGNYDDINSIKIKAYIYLGCSLLSSIPTIGMLFSGIGFIFLILAVRGITKISNMPLVKNLLIYWVLNFIGAIMVSISVIGAFFGSGSILTNMRITGFIGFAFIIASAIFAYFYYKNLSIATNEKFFMYAFIARVIASLTSLTIVFFILFLILATILEAIAWFKFKEIKNINQQ